MATFSRIPLDDAQRAVMAARRATQEQYRQYIRALTAEEAGPLELGPDDRPITERARLKAAGQAEGVNLHIQRRGNTIVFWETQEVPKPRTTASRGRARSTAR